MSSTEHDQHSGSVGINTSPSSSPHEVQRIIDIFNHPSADIIIRSSDNVDFPAFKLLLSLTSSFFQTMFSLPQSSKPSDAGEKKDDLPLIRMEETSTTIEKMLGFCHPAYTPRLENLDEVKAVLEVAMKYDMEGVTRCVKETLRSPRFIEKDSDAMRVFAIACNHGLEEEARMAAHRLLHVPISLRPYVIELERTSAGTLHRLQSHYFRSAKDASELATHFQWITRDSYTWFRCGSCQQHNSQITIAGGLRSVHPRMWWWNYMQEVAAALAVRPSGAAVKESDLVNRAFRKASECNQCRQSVFDDMKEFTDVFAAKVEEAISKVELNIGV